MKKAPAFTAQGRGEGLLRIHFLWPGGIFGPCSFGTRTIKSVKSQPSTSQILSSCSRLTRVVTSWYNSLIVLGRMPVLRARSACVHLSSPSRVDSNILNYKPVSFMVESRPCLKKGRKSAKSTKWQWMRDRQRREKRHRACHNAWQICETI